MSPFFLRQYVKGHAGDVFEAYPQLLTEMVLRLPYQVLRPRRLNQTLTRFLVRALRFPSRTLKVHRSDWRLCSLLCRVSH